MQDLFSEIENELNLHSPEQEQEKKASAQFLDPLSETIHQFLASNPDASTLDKVASSEQIDFDEPHAAPEKRVPELLSAEMVMLEKQAGKQIWEDGIHRFVYNAEQAGFSREDIERELETQLGSSKSAQEQPEQKVAQEVNYVTPRQEIAPSISDAPMFAEKVMGIVNPGATQKSASHENVVDGAKSGLQYYSQHKIQKTAGKTDGLSNLVTARSSASRPNNDGLAFLVKARNAASHQ
jgi:hypothetical protein